MKKFAKILALTLAAAVSCAFLPACSNSANQKKNTLIFAQGSDPRGLDPALVDDGESSKIIVNVYEGLLKYAKDSTKVEPCLATSWDISKDGLVYTFHLRQGVKFQDGTDFNADAVKYNIERQLPPRVTSDMSYAEFVFGAVKSVEAVDTNTVKITLKSPCTPFLSNLAMSLGAPMVSPTALKKYNNNVDEHPCGTGPFSFVSWTKGQDVVLKRNDNYWGDKAKMQNLIFKFISDNSARVVALNNGEADIIDGIDATVVNQIKNAGNKIYQAPGMNVNYMAYNVTKSPLTDKAIRTAISEAVNVPELVKSLYQGYADPAESVLPTFMNGYSSSVKQIGYNPTAAKAAFAAKHITSLHMITYSNPRPYNTANGQALAEAIQGYLKKVGVNATIDAYDWTTYKTKVKSQDFDICFYGWTGDNGDPDNFMSLLSVQDPSQNVSHYNDPQFNALIAKGVATPAGAARDSIYTQLEQNQAANAVWLPISHSKLLSAYRPNVKDFYYHMTGNVFLSGVSKD